MGGLVVTSPFTKILHNSTTHRLMRKMETYRNVYVFSVPYVIEWVCRKEQERVESQRPSAEFMQNINCERRCVLIVLIAVLRRSLFASMKWAHRFRCAYFWYLLLSDITSIIMMLPGPRGVGTKSWTGNPAPYRNQCILKNSITKPWKSMKRQSPYQKRCND